MVQFGRKIYFRNVGIQNINNINMLLLIRKRRYNERKQIQKIKVKPNIK